MTELYPLRFQPILRRYLWGGRRLESVLGKSLGAGADFAESWEIVDHGRDQSIVLSGPLAGRALGDLVKSHGRELGVDPASSFPLLFKFLDANQPLSVQVHPNDEQAARLTPPDLGKTEAWLIVHADPGSLVYAGLKRGFDAPAFAREVQRGTTELCLHRFEPQVGDCIFIPAGVVHALGAGLVVAEIQQSSDTTFRLYDWNRVGVDGRPRQLHIEQGLPVIDYDYGPVAPQVARPTARAAAEQLVACDKFDWLRWRINGEELLGGDGRSHLLAVLEGSILVEGDPTNEPLSRGQTMLLPASVGPVRVRSIGNCRLLDGCPGPTGARC